MDKIKQFLADDSLFYGLLIVLVAVTAYGLGKHSSAEKVAQPMASEVILTQTVLESDTESKVTPNTATAETAQYVASKNGSRYHHPWCPGASQMKEENKIYFDSIEAARAAGYTPAANCKGLE